MVKQQQKKAPQPVVQTKTSTRVRKPTGPVSASKNIKKVALKPAVPKAAQRITAPPAPKQAETTPNQTAVKSTTNKNTSAKKVSAVKQSARKSSAKKQ